MDVCGELLGLDVCGELVGPGVTGALVGSFVGLRVGVSEVGSGVVGEKVGSPVGKGVPTEQHLLIQSLHCASERPVFNWQAARAGPEVKAQAGLGPPGIRSPLVCSALHRTIDQTRSCVHPLRVMESQVCALLSCSSAAAARRIRIEHRFIIMLRLVALGSTRLPFRLSDGLSAIGNSS